MTNFCISGGPVGDVPGERRTSHLGQIVGGLHDEFDTAPQMPLSSPAGVMTLDGTTSLRDLTTQLHWTFPREAGVETLAGFLLTELGHIPTAGEMFEDKLEARRYIVANMQGQRIARVRVESTTGAPLDLSTLEAEQGREATA